MTSTNQCRFCGAALGASVVDLGSLPLANALLTAEQLCRAEPSYPLCVSICPDCHLVQLRESERPEQLFSDYVYFSSFSESWRKHCERYAAEMIERLKLHSESTVVEIGSNDGCLLQYFAQSNVRVLGVEPAANIAEAAVARGIRTEVMFFGRESAAALAADGHAADLVVANNVLGHAPDINSFVEGLTRLLKPQGIITLEFPHLLRLIELTQFDTIYHEHVFYFSLGVVDRILSRHGLSVFDVDELPAHGGSLRVYATHGGDAARPVSENVETLRRREDAAGLDRASTYRAFRDRILTIKNDLRGFLAQAQRAGQTVAGYGAPAKGSMLLNVCGIGPDLLPYTVDRSPHKQSRFLPGSHIPIHAPDIIETHQPDYLLILPWNLEEEIAGQMAVIREWGGQFVVPIPQVRVF